MFNYSNIVVYIQMYGCDKGVAVEYLQLDMLKLKNINKYNILLYNMCLAGDMVKCGEYG